MNDEVVRELLARVKALEQQIERTKIVENQITIQGYVTTTDATTTTVATVPIPASTSVFMEIHVVARRTGGSAGSAEDGAAYLIQAAYKNVAGVATQIALGNVDYTAESQIAWNATVAASGGDVLVRVTGAANNNISWHCSVTVWKISS